MRRLTKKIAAATLALVLVLAMGTQCFAANWNSYFGAVDGAGKALIEGADGSLTNNTSKAWTAHMDTIGYNGIWGAQVSQKVNIKKGTKYTLSFSIKSTNTDKLVYVKISKGESVAYATWIKLTAGATKTHKVTFKAASNADQITFGIGGEFGDRQNSGEKDVTYRYNLAKNQGLDIVDVANENGIVITPARDKDGDASDTTDVAVTNYSLKMAKLKAVSNKKTNIKNLNAYLKFNGKVSAKKSGYNVTIKRSGSAVVLQAKKGKKMVVNAKVKASNYKKVLKKIDSKGSKAINSVLKSKTGLTLKSIGK